MRRRDRMHVEDFAVGGFAAVEVFAVPGRINDPKNEGCNQLIRDQKATIITSPEDIAKELGWMTAPAEKKYPQLTLNFQLHEIEKAIISLLDKNSPIHIDVILNKLKLSPGQLHQYLLELEMKQLIRALPGNQYCRT